MSRPRVFVSRIIAEKALEKLSEEADIEVWQDELPPSYEVLTEKIHDAEGLLSLLTDKVDAALMDAASYPLPGAMAVCAAATPTWSAGREASV